VDFKGDNNKLEMKKDGLRIISLRKNMKEVI
jgi:hypothetical protein